MDDNGVNHIPRSVSAMKPVNYHAPKSILFPHLKLWSEWCDANVAHLRKRGFTCYYVHREEDENGLWYCCICKME